MPKETDYGRPIGRMPRTKIDDLTRESESLTYTEVQAVGRVDQLEKTLQTYKQRLARSQTERRRLAKKVQDLEAENERLRDRLADVRTDAVNH